MKPLSLTYGERLMSPMDDAAMAYLQSGPSARRWLLTQARRTMKAHRITAGYVGNSVALLTSPTSQPKLAKSVMPTYGLSLLPARGAAEAAVVAFGKAVNLCPLATAGCEAACLNTSGKGALNSVQRARLVRTMFLMEQPWAAGTILAHEILRALDKHGEIRVRLNVLSDIRWELVLPKALRALRALGAGFYDYTKWAPALRAAEGLIHLTYSASERWSDRDIADAVAKGHNVAVVFAARKVAVKHAASLGAQWKGLPIVDGISTDDRTTDPSGVIVALAALGKGTHDESGFVRRWAGDVAIPA